MIPTWAELSEDLLLADTVSEPWVPKDSHLRSGPEACLWGQTDSFQVLCLFSTWPWISCLTFLGLNFLTCGLVEVSYSP